MPARVATSLLAALALCSCGGDVTGASGPQTGPTQGTAPSASSTRSLSPGVAAQLDPCRIVDLPAAESALGSPLGAATPDDGGSVRTCTYAAAPPSTVTLQVRQRELGKAADAPAEFTSGRRSVQAGRAVTEVPGLGDEAYAAALPEGGRLVVARKGTTEVLVSTTGTVSADQALAVARLAVSRALG